MAQNIYISAIHLGNFADIDPNEALAGAENGTAILGTYGSTTDPLWTHRVTLDTDSPTQYIDEDDTGGPGNGTLTYDTGSGTVVTNMDSFGEYNVTITYSDNTQETIVIDIVQTTNGDVFMIPWDNYTQLDDKPIEIVTLNSVHDDSWVGFGHTGYDDIAFVCFTPGTMIATPSGDRPVETLRVGDLVTTRDHGAQPITWVGRRHLRFDGSNDGQKPVAFRPGCLGPGMPTRQLVVSPQHRILLSAPEIAPLTGATEAFAPAHALTGRAGVRRMAGKRQVDYIALMFARHEVIEAGGTPVESFHPGPMGLATLSPFELLTLRAADPAATRAPRPAARPLLTPRQTRGLVRQGVASAAPAIPARTPQ